LQIIEQTATPPKKKSVLDLLFGRPLSSDEWISAWGFSLADAILTTVYDNCLPFGRARTESRKDEECTNKP
jgi:hypothetical protein